MRWIPGLLPFLLFLPTAEGRDNVALLGVVALERKDGQVVAAHVLKKSPAVKAGVKKGDLLLALNGRRLRKAPDVDAILDGLEAGTDVTVTVRRGEEPERELTAKLVARAKYTGEFLTGQKSRGRTGFKSPGWFGYAWANTSEERPAPTPENTKGKVVVFHAFQSW